MAEQINIPSGKTRVFIRTYGIPGNATTDPSGTTRYTIANGGVWFVRDTSTFMESGVTGDITFIASENNTDSARTASLTVTATTSPDSRYEGIASAVCAYTITQAAGGSTPPGPEPPTPTETYIYYTAVGLVGGGGSAVANVDLAVVVESYDGGRDVNSFSLTLPNGEKEGHLMGYLNPEAGSTNLHFIVSVTGFSATVDGQLSMRVAYADYDSDYQQIGTGGAIEFRKDYQSAGWLYIDVIFTPSNG